MIERLSGSDALLLHLDVPGTPMHTLKTAVVDPSQLGRQLTIDDLVDGVSWIAGVLPRLHQRVRAAPGFPGRPFWVDDPEFDVRRHVNEVWAPAPGDRAALDQIHSRLAGERLERDRPLWAITLVHGLEGGRQAMITRLHHAIVDGGGAAHALALVTDREPGARPPAPAPPPATAVPDRELMATAVRQLPGLVGELGRLLRDAQRSHRREQQFRREHPEQLRVPSAPRNFSSEPLDQSRSCTSCRLPLDAIQQVAKASGTSVNGVYHALIAAAFRDELEGHGDELEGATVSFAIASDDGDPLRVSGNFVTPTFVRICAEEADPVQRLQRTAQYCANAVELQRLGGLDLTGRWATYTCRLGPWITRRFSPRMPRLPNHITTANVKGPDHRRWVGKVEVTDWLSYAVVVSPANINITAYSYAGGFSIGLLVGGNVLADPQRFLERMRTELEDLQTRLGVAGSTAGTDTASSASPAAAPTSLN